MLREIKKDTKGITLVSLVVTIIILLILAGVTISLTIGENGIIKKTEQSVADHNKQEAKEKINFKITDLQIKKYGEEKKLPNLQELSDWLCEDEEIEYVHLEKKVIGSLRKIEIGEAESIFTKLKKYPYEFEINNELQLASIDGVKLASKEETVTVNKAEYEALKSDVETLKSQISTLQNKTTMKTVGKNIESPVSVSSGTNVKLVSITIDEDCYADIYAQFEITNNDSEAYKGILLYVNGEMVAVRGKGGIGGNVQENINRSMVLKKGDIVSINVMQYTGKIQTVNSGFIQINYFPYNSK